MPTVDFRGIRPPHEIELLRGLKRREVDLIFVAGRLRRFAAKCVMTHQGEPADQLLLLWKGRARYFFVTPTGKRLIHAWITPGHVFGGAALISRPSPYVVSSEAVEDSVVVAWDGPTIRELARRFPKLLENALLIASGYIHWYIAAHAASTFKSAPQRLADVLVQLASSVGKKSSDGIELNVTNEELADSANISLYTTSRIISKFQKLGAVRKRRGKVLLQSPERLFSRRV